MKKQFTIEQYKTGNGKIPFQSWLKKLKDRLAWSKIMVRLDRIRMGNFGDSKSIGEGLSELKIDSGSGYRIYFGKTGKTVVLLLVGGTKKTQPSDIKKAKEYWKDFKSRSDE